MNKNQQEGDNIEKDWLVRIEDKNYKTFKFKNPLFWNPHTEEILFSSVYEHIEEQWQECGKNGEKKEIIPVCGSIKGDFSRLSIYENPIEGLDVYDFHLAENKHTVKFKIINSRAHLVSCWSLFTDLKLSELKDKINEHRYKNGINGDYVYYFAREHISEILKIISENFFESQYDPFFMEQRVFYSNEDRIVSIDPFTLSLGGGLRIEDGTILVRGNFKELETPIRFAISNQYHPQIREELNEHRIIIGCPSVFIKNLLEFDIDKILLNKYIKRLV